METAQVLINRQAMVHIYNGILLSHKNGVPFAIAWMDPEGSMLSERNQSQILYNFTYMWNLTNKTETDS